MNVFDEVSFSFTSAPAVAPSRPKPDRDAIQQTLTRPSPALLYKPSLPISQFTFSTGNPYLDPWQFYLDLETMIATSVVQTPLGIVLAAVHGAEFEIEAYPDEAQAFAKKTYDDFWYGHLASVQRGYEYGWSGSEVYYAEDEGLLCFDGLRAFGSRDVRALSINGNLVGVRVQNVQGSGTVDLWSGQQVPAKGLWYAHRPRNDPFYGVSQLWPAWRPWARLSRRDGCEEVIDGGFYRFAVGGICVRHPVDNNTTATNRPAGTGPLANREWALQMAENYKSGGNIAMDSVYDKNGNPLWAIENIFDGKLNLAPLLDYEKRLHDLISLGIGVPPEMIQASETGSGYSGRAIPLEGFYTMQQVVANAICEAFRRQVAEPLLRWNFGPDARLKVKVKPLLESRMKAMTANTQSGTGGEPPKENAGDDQPAGGLFSTNGHHPLPAQKPPQSRFEGLKLSANGTAVLPKAIAARMATLADVLTPRDPGHDPVPEAKIALSSLSANCRIDLIRMLQAAPIEERFLRARQLLEFYRVLMARTLRDSSLAALLLGVRRVADSAGMPHSISTAGFAPPAGPDQVIAAPPAVTASEMPPILPWTPTMIGAADESDNVLLPIIDAAAKDLAGRKAITREVFDSLDAHARADAFTVAGQESEAVLNKVKDIIAEATEKGDDLRTFVRRVEDEVGEGTFLNDAHAENVFRTNVQTAYSKGMDAVLNDPMVDDLFPYEQVIPIHDHRTREWHLKLGNYGLNGTGVFRRDDQNYQSRFKPPSDYQCRCARRPLSVAQAAALGVEEAKHWLESGEPPVNPEYVSVPSWWQQSPTFIRMSLTILSTDAEGHDHKGKGEGGGQFTSNGEGAEPPSHNIKLPKNRKLSIDQARAIYNKVRIYAVKEFRELESTYGKAGAIAILSVVAVPIPGTSLAPIAAKMLAHAAKKIKAHYSPAIATLATSGSADADEATKAIVRMIQAAHEASGEKMPEIDVDAIRAAVIKQMTTRLSTDAHGAEHKGKGEGGGQFVSHGQGGDSATKDKSKKFAGDSSLDEKQPATRGAMAAATRQGKGKDARIMMADGSPAPEHIQAGKIPPQWKDVQVSLDPKADVLATGRDAAGRAKVIYRDEFHMRNAAHKFARTRVGLVEAQSLYEQNQRNRKTNPEEADCSWLMQVQATRPGSDSDTKAKVKAYGATTLRAEHVVEAEDGTRLQFVGKEGVYHDHLIHDQRLADMLLDRKRTADERNGKLFATDYDKVAKYAKSLDTGRFTPKDFRTIKANQLAIAEISKQPEPPKSLKEYKARVKAVAEKVSSVLGNNWKQSLESYVDPTLFSAWRVPAAGVA